jgi:hypothetical protein
MRVRVRGRGTVTLSKADFKASGGEGDVYVKGDTAYKIFADPSRMIPEAKIAELAALSHPNIVRPREVVTDSADVPVGYSMRYVDNAVPLCKTFPATFRNRVGLSPQRVCDLVRKLRVGVDHVHAHGILVVDLNEMNVLVGESLDEVFFLDVDSYQTKSFPATALMDSVRDRHASAFDDGTDWFAFAIVTFQMFVGIHPYRGTYPPFLGTVDKDKRLDARMRSNISVLHAGVTLPPATLPFTVIPPAYLDWYTRVFEDGARLAPPLSPGLSVRVATAVPRSTSGGAAFDVFEVCDYPEEIVALAGDAVLTTKGLYVGRRRLCDVSFPATVGTLPRSGHVVVGTHAARELHFLDATDGREIPCQVAAEALMAVDGRFYAKHGSTILEIGFVELAARTLVTARVACGVLEHATQLFDGVAMENLLGAWYALLFPAPGTCHQVRLSELDGYTILEAKCVRSLLAVAATRGGRCDSFVFRFDREFRRYDSRVAASSGAYTGLEVTVLSNDVCLFLNEGSEFELFSLEPGDSGMRVLTDENVCGDVRLFGRGSQALFARGGTLFGFRMR